MSTPKTIGNKAIRAFFNQSLDGVSTLGDCLNNGDDIDGADLVDAVADFYETCRKEGIL